MRYSLTVLLIVLAVAGIVASWSKSDSPPRRQMECFPLEVGRWWTYRSPGVSSGVRVEISPSDTHKAADGTLLTGWISVGDPDAEEGGGDYGLVGGQVWQYMANGGRGIYPFPHPQLFLRCPLRVGDTWEWGPYGAGYAAVEREERLTVPAGTFTCFKVHRVNSPGRTPHERSEQWEWYAPGIGLVEELMNNHDFDLVLKAYGTRHTRMPP